MFGTPLLLCTAACAFSRRLGGQLKPLPPFPSPHPNVIVMFRVCFNCFLFASRKWRRGRCSPRRLPLPPPPRLRTKMQLQLQAARLQTKAVGPVKLIPRGSCDKERVWLIQFISRVVTSFIWGRDGGEGERHGNSMITTRCFTYT